MPVGLKTDGLAFVAVGAVTLAGLVLRDAIDADLVALVYLVVVTITAIAGGLRPAIIASFLSVILLNLLFVPPYLSLSVADPNSAVTLGVMLVSAVCVSIVSARVAGRARAADRERVVFSDLLELARQLAAVDHASGVDTALAGPSARRLEAAGEEAVAAMMATLAETTRDRIDRHDDAARLAAESENEKLRNVLLASVGHDLRTPLTVLAGNAASLMRLRKKLPREAIDEVVMLTRNIESLQKFTGNLLRIAAISDGRLVLNRQPYAIAEIAGVSIARLDAIREERRVVTRVTGDLPMVNIDGALMEQVISNLLENAVAHTRSDGTIILALEPENGGVRVSVLDDGQGLPEDAAHIFERFRTGGPASDRTRGHGLGLAICRGIVEAHGGHIEALNRTDAQGAVFRFSLPAMPANRGRHDDPDHRG